MDLEELTIRISVSADDAESRLSALCERLSALENPASAASDAFSAMASSLGDQRGALSSASQGADAYARSVRAIETQARRLNAELSAKRVLAENLRELQKTITAYQKGQRSQADYNRAIAEMGETFGASASDADDAQGRIRALAATLSGDLSRGVGACDNLLASLIAVESSAYINGGVSVDTASAHAALAGLSSEAQALLALLQALGVVSTGAAPRSGGGGGRRRAEQEAEEAAREAEEARRSAIQADYDLLDHRRHMNEITLEEYIALLNGMYHRHALTAEEIMELDERIYDAEQELMRARADQVDTLAEGMVTALENRYQKMLDAETDKLDQSREAWRMWADDSTAAIQAQIDALDQLADTEDREKKDAEELRKIAKLRQDIEFEQDAYNRAQLQQQLEQAIAAREERLHKLDISDQQAALREQIEAIRLRAEEEMGALDKQQAGIEAAYEERMQQAALEAEAQRLLMSASQQDILALIGEFAPEYNATGQTLGEKLASGFLSRVGDIEDWFAAFNARIEAMQAGIAQTALAAADQLYAGYPQRDAVAAAGTVAVHQTVNINQPVETPGEYARRMRQIDEELGETILRGM